MAQWFFLLGIVALALVCPALMWLGRRGIGPGCAVCLPRREEDSLDELQARQRRLSRQIEQFEARQRVEPAAPTRD